MTTRRGPFRLFGAVVVAAALLYAGAVVAANMGIDIPFRLP
jgi:hypothetical protein